MNAVGEAFEQDCATAGLLNPGGPIDRSTCEKMESEKHLLSPIKQRMPELNYFSRIQKTGSALLSSGLSWRQNPNFIQENLARSLRKHSIQPDQNALIKLKLAVKETSGKNVFANCSGVSANFWLRELWGNWPREKFGTYHSRIRILYRQCRDESPWRTITNTQKVEFSSWSDSSAKMKL